MGEPPMIRLPPLQKCSESNGRLEHLLIVFGGVEGLEPAVACEEALADCEDDVGSLFDHYLNLCPRQGSRTIRSEEAVLVGMAALRPHVERAQAVR